MVFVWSKPHYVITSLVHHRSGTRHRYYARKFGQFTRTIKTVFSTHAGHSKAQIEEHKTGDSLEVGQERCTATQVVSPL